MKLYAFWRSLATYRVRIALNLKGLLVTEEQIDLDRGDQHAPAFQAINPMGSVPALVLDNGTVLTQSLAILEWIEETHPAPPLLPPSAIDRARVRALCAIHAADSHPLVTPRIQSYLTQNFGADDAAKLAWSATWFGRGLEAYERLLPKAGQFCFGETPTMADCCLASHIAGSQRFKVDLAPYPSVRRIHDACMAMPEFARAHPSKQVGAPAG